MKTIILNPMKKVISVLNHVLIQGNGTRQEQGMVALPLIVIIVAAMLIFGHRG
jgi:hypothetical protein